MKALSCPGQRRHDNHGFLLFHRRAMALVHIEHFNGRHAQLFRPHANHRAHADQRRQANRVAVILQEITVAHGRITAALPRFSMITGR